MSATLDDDDEVQQVIDDLLSCRPPHHFDGVRTLVQRYAQVAVQCRRLAASARGSGFRVFCLDAYQDSLAEMMSLATELKLWPGDSREPPRLQ